MRKITAIIVVSVIVIVVSIGVISTLLLFPKNEFQDQNDNTLHWLPNESYFVDYEINGDDIKFRYAIIFVNDSSYDATISLAAKFSSKELKGWIKTDKFIIGCDENDNMISEVISKGGKKEIIFTFKGKYLGGKVNEKISFPEEIILMS